MSSNPPGGGGTRDEYQRKEDDALLRNKASPPEQSPLIPLLIWPEAIIDQGVFQDRPLNEAVHGICEVYDGYFMLGSQDFDIGAGRKLYNAAYLFTPMESSTKSTARPSRDPRRSTCRSAIISHAAQGHRHRHEFHAGPGPVNFVMEKPG